MSLPVMYLYKMTVPTVSTIVLRIRAGWRDRRSRENAMVAEIATDTSLNTNNFVKERRRWGKRRRKKSSVLTLVLFEQSPTKIPLTFFIQPTKSARKSYCKQKRWDGVFLCDQENLRVVMSFLMFAYETVQEPTLIVGKSMCMHLCCVGI